MKKYLVFTFPTYYPGGGMIDYAGDADTIEDAIEIVRNSEWGDHYQIVHHSDMKIVESK